MKDNVYRILIVDDSPQDRATYRRFLTGDGPSRYDIHETASGADGLKWCRAESPDCVLLEYRLPDLNGLEFLADLKATAGRPGVPVVMLTGQGNERVAVQAMKSG